MEANKDASGTLKPLFEDLQNSDSSLHGFKLSDLHEPGWELRVYTRPEDEPVASKREAQKIDTAYSDQRIVEHLEAIEREEGPMTRKAAMDILEQRRGHSPSWILWAIKRNNRRSLP